MGPVRAGLVAHADQIEPAITSANNSPIEALERALPLRGFCATGRAEEARRWLVAGWGLGMGR